jgi:hypothetical protein
MMRTLLFALALAAPAVADAATFHLNYTTSVDSTSGPATIVDAILTTDDGEYYGGTGYQVLGITGTRGAEAITFDTTTLYDEIFFPANSSGNIVDEFGLDFIAGGVTYNLYKFTGDFAYHEYDGATGRLVFDDQLTLAQVRDVPEPATWAMMIAGFGLVGGALRRRRIVGMARAGA